MAIMSSGKMLGEALFDVLSQNATNKQIVEIAAILKKFKETKGRSYKDVKRQPFARSLIEAMEEACRYHDEQLED